MVARLISWVFGACLVTVLIVTDARRTKAQARTAYHYASAV